MRKFRKFTVEIVDPDTAVTVGTVVVSTTDEHAEPIQMAASAREAVLQANYRVDGETFTGPEIEEWWA